ncbi:DUF3320 domain-containing protein [Rathayibacter oskolensis]|uniref:DUF3320 domain-containing protein n=1 Tax=Rathayibacter oskolensis TaxID=1891671 RepID=UPI00265F28FA|nr:DUF3320 domain-containing protein [Rathayibacter oskolensis]WKK72616.1 DUF3320 domain-containing protein [Rathayibacter oskolensis]
MTTANGVFHSRGSVQLGLDHLALRLNDILTRKLAHVLGTLEWPTVLRELDRAKGYPERTYDSADLQAQLRMLTERLGGLKYPFDDPYTRVVSTLGSELRIVRNRWAHNDDFTGLDAWRTQDFVVRLLEHFNDGEGLPVARELREAAMLAVVQEYGIVPTAAPSGVAEQEEPAEKEEDVVPDQSVLVREDAAATPTIGASRTEFEPWTVVSVGDVNVLDDLPKKAAKEKVRAVVAEITAFEGPIALERLAQLVGRSFGLQRVHAARSEKIRRQIKASEVFVDPERFVWPLGLDPETWSEFRPNTSGADRNLLHISSREIANAAEFLLRTDPQLDRTTLEIRLLQTFGRRRRTPAFTSHLAKGIARLPKA